MIIIKEVQKIFLRELGIPVDEYLLTDDLDTLLRDLDIAVINNMVAHDNKLDMIGGILDAIDDDLYNWNIEGSTYRMEERMPHYMFCPYNGKSVLQDWSLFDKLTDMLFEITDDEGFIRDILLAMKKDVGYKKLINYIRATPDITKEKIVWYSKNWKKWL